MIVLVSMQLVSPSMPMTISRRGRIDLTGLALTLVLLFLFLMHLYFNFLPEHRSFLISMLRGYGPEKARGGKTHEPDN